MKKPKAPCFKCEDRVIGCHGSCERYKEYAGIVAQDREERKAIAEVIDHTYAKLSPTELRRRSGKKKWQ